MKGHICAICDRSPSHVMSMAAIGRALQKRGYAFTIVQTEEAEPVAIREGVQFLRIPHEETDEDRPQRLDDLSRERGVSIRRSNRLLVQNARLICEGAPDLLRQADPDLLLADQSEPGASVVADALKIPFVTLCNALPLNRDYAVPPCFLPWAYKDSPWGRLRNRVAYNVRDIVIRPVFQVLNYYRKKWGLTAYRTPDDSFSRLAQFTQMIPEFDLPHLSLPACFHYVGPYQQGKSRQSAFDWGWLDGRPLIYASLGTIMGNNAQLVSAIAESCADLGAQVILSLGGRGQRENHTHLSNDVLVVSYVPQLELLERAELLVTHAGLNTVMEALAVGVPMVAIPIAFDQPGVAARIAYSGVGEVLPVADCRRELLRPLVQRVLAQVSYRANAVKLKQAMMEYRGSEAAADIVEQVLATRQPVNWKATGSS